MYITNVLCAQFLRQYYEATKARKDENAQCESLAAMARSHESLGKVDAAIAALHEYIEVAEAARLEEAYSRGCSLLGTVLNRLVCSLPSCCCSAALLWNIITFTFTYGLVRLENTFRYFICNFN